MARRKIVLLAVAAAGGLGLLSMADAQGFRRYRRLQGELSAMKERNARMREENTRLFREVQALRAAPQAIERAAREELGFVKPGEIIINVE